MADSEELNRIIEACRQGDAEAFAELVDIYSQRCYGYFYSMVGRSDVSDDLLSRLFMRLVEKISTFKGGNFESWLFKVASNIFHDYLRTKQKETKVIEARTEQIAGISAQPKQSDSEISARLQRQLLRLDSDTRELIMLRYYSQMSFKELAGLRSEPIGTVLSRVHRGLNSLRQAMEK